MLRSSAMLCLFFVCLTMVQGEIDLKTATGIWLFDEGKGKIASDLSGQKGDGKLPKKWYFVSGIYNGKEYELYINGEFKSKGVNAIGAPAKGLLIGSGLCPAGHGCDGGYFKGIIDDVSMFKTKLSEADLKKLMDDGVGVSLGLLPVQVRGKLATTWSTLKQP